jgi:hypothetical protein
MVLTNFVLCSQFNYKLTAIHCHTSTPTATNIIAEKNFMVFERLLKQCLKGNAAWIPLMGKI